MFWSIVYRLCKGIGLKFFSGEKNWGQVFRKETEKSKYSPDKSKINFAVPDEKTLRDMNHDLLKIIPPGKIRCALNLLKGKKDIVLMADGKMVTKGLQSNFRGDMDLFGHEILLNLTDLQEKLNTEMELYSKCAINYTSGSDGDKFTTLCEIGDSLCGMIEKIRNFHYEQRKKLKSFTSGNYPVKPDKAISACKTHMYTSSIWIRKALQLNVKLLKFMTNLQNNGHMVRTESTVHMDQITNVRLLHDADYIDKNIDRNEHPHLMKKYSDQWKDLVKESLLTEQCVSSSLGMNGIKEMKYYFQKLVKEENVEEMFTKMKNDNFENDAICTIGCMVMPAILPSCAVFYEEGCSYIDGKYNKKLLSTSPLGIIR